MERTFADGKFHSTEESGINRDGTLSHWIVRTSPIYDAEGRIVAAMEISHDITKRKQLEVELEKSEDKYHAIFESIPNPVFVLDPQTYEILDVNHSANAVYGYPREALVGGSFFDLFPESEQVAFKDRLRTMTSINRAHHRHQSGRWLIVNIRIPPATYTQRQVLLVTASDITKRLEAEQQLIQAGKMATLGEMATGVAHELNQPLSVIKTVSTFFLKKLDGGDEIKPRVLDDMLRKIDKNVDRAAKIINHMRQFARKSDLALERVAISQVIDNAFEIFSQQLKVRGIEVERELEPDLPRIKADPGRLEQVFINLLLNARDAIEERAAQQTAPYIERRIRLAAYRTGSLVICQVCDTGIGMSPEIAEKVFEPFFTTKEVGKGTGLGLSISYGIIQECGGTIRALAREGGGTCFEMSFPLEDDPNESNVH